MKLVAVQLVLITALILTLNIKLTLGQNDVTLLENEEDDNIIEKDAVSQYLQNRTKHYTIWLCCCTLTQILDLVFCAVLISLRKLIVAYRHLQKMC